MPSFEIIAIGTELLLGEITDTNTQYLAKVLNRIGYDIFRTMIIGDNSQRIAEAIKESISRCDYVITTGGLGPTVDDPTRQAVANALEMPLDFHPELWEQIQKRFNKYNRIPTENNRKQAFLPRQAFAIENPVGTAPAFWIESGQKCIICLPGVPAEVDYLIESKIIPLLQTRFPSGKIIHSIVVHTSGLGESQVDEVISDLERLKNPTVGLSAHPAQVDIRVTAKADSLESAKLLVAPVVKDLEYRLGNAIFGFNETQLSDVVRNLKKDKSQKIIAFINHNMHDLGEKFINLLIFDELHVVSDENSILEIMRQSKSHHSQAYLLGIELKSKNKNNILLQYLITPVGIVKEKNYDLSPPSQQSVWQENKILNFLRIHLT